MGDKKYILFGLVIGLVVLVTALSVFLVVQKTASVLKTENSVSLGAVFDYVSCDSGSGFGTSSISHTGAEDGVGFWLINGATSTITCDMRGAVSADLNLFLVGSTTAVDLYWEYMFSNTTTTPEGERVVSNATLGNDSTDDLAVWFAEDTKTAISKGEVSHSAATTTHNWSPGVSTSTKNITIPLVASDWMQVRFSVSADSAGALYSEIIKKEPIN